VERNSIELFYLDAIIHKEMSPDERDEELKRLKEESDNLKEWKQI
jgi:hypothetical protein